jgi:hypothetical protein
MSSTSYKHRSRRQSKAKKGSARFVYLIIGLCVLGLVVGGFTLHLSQPTQASTSQYAGIPGPNDWTAETPVQIYNRSNGQWEPMTYGDVGPDMEFIVGDYLYATTPEKGSLFLKPEIDISLLAETDRAFDPNNWRMPKPDDVVFLFRSSSNQQKGHWLLKHVQPDSEVVFQGKVWKWELDVENQRFVVSDTGNVFARVTETHVNVHEGDVLALTVKYNSCGKTGIITGSEEHPFFVVEKEGYIPMVQLEPGMTLKTDNGAGAVVVDLQPLSETMEMYNLTVEHVHNYYVFADENDPGILVHNANCGVGFNARQLQSKFKHASDFGVPGNYNPQNAQAFQNALETHIQSPGTQQIVGTYRGTQNVIHYYDPSTGLNVMVDATTNDFISGWRLSPDQIINLLNHGNVQ